MNEYLIGQRVIYNGEIAVVIKAPDKRPSASSYDIWIMRPAVGYESCVSRDNVKPLPGGQL